jgi:hypothetical protein
VENEKHVPDKDLEDRATSPAAPSKAVATEEHDVVGDNVLSTNLAFPYHNQCHVQSDDNRAFAHCNVLPSTMDGVHTPILGVGSINMHDPPCTGL